MAIKFNSTTDINTVTYNGSSCNLVYYKPSSSSSSTCVWAKPTTLMFASVTNPSYFTSVRVLRGSMVGPDGTIGPLFLDTSAVGSSYTVYYGDGLSCACTMKDPTYSDWTPSSITKPDMVDVWRSYNTLTIGNDNDITATLYDLAYSSSTSTTTTIGTLTEGSTITATLSHPVVPGTVKLNYVDLVDNKNGSFVQLNTGTRHTTTVGSINYETGYIEITDTSVLQHSNSVSATYRYASNISGSSSATIPANNLETITCTQNGYLHKYYFTAYSSRTKTTYTGTGGLYNGSSTTSVASLTVGTDTIQAKFIGSTSISTEYNNLTSDAIWLTALADVSISAVTISSKNYAQFTNTNTVAMTVYYCWGSNSGTYSSVTIPAATYSGTTLTSAGTVNVLNPNTTATTIYGYAVYNGYYTGIQSQSVEGNITVLPGNVTVSG